MSRVLYILLRLWRSIDWMEVFYFLLVFCGGFVYGGALFSIMVCEYFNVDFWAFYEGLKNFSAAELKLTLGWG